MTEFNDQIQAFLAIHPHISATGLHPAINKAGIIPVLAQNPRRYYVMKPKAARPDLGLPEFQICKGTRMFLDGNAWKDMRGDVPTNATLEPLPNTALREGIEELGLKLENISALQSLGEFSFASATTGKEKNMWLFAAIVKNAEDFLPHDKVQQTTHERAWLTLAEFKMLGRADHHHVLSIIDAKLET